MKIYIATGTGQGFSEIAALDAALAEAGALNFNLIPMTSIIPVGSEVVDGALVAAYGSRVYVVMSKCTTTLPGSYAIAGLSWAQCEDGRGIFAEAHGHDEAAMDVEVQKTLKQMAYLRHLAFHGDEKGNDECIVVKDSRIASINLTDYRSHACAVVVAYYEAHGWGVTKEQEVGVRARLGWPDVPTFENKQ